MTSWERPITLPGWHNLHLMQSAPLSPGAWLYTALTLSRHSLPSRSGAKSVTSREALLSATSLGTVSVGSPCSMKKGMLSAFSLGSTFSSPRSMKQNWRAPACTYAGTCNRAAERSADLV